MRFAGTSAAMNPKLQVFLIKLCAILAAVCVLWGGFNWLTHWYWGSIGNMQDLGNYGSYLQGAVASPWTLATVLLLFVAFLYQENQLKLQSRQFDTQIKQFEEEAKAKEAELRDAKEQFNLQQASIRKQQFENTFFQLIHLHNEFVAQMQSIRAQGKQCFMAWFSIYASDFESWQSRRIHMPSTATPMPKGTDETVWFYEEYFYAQNEYVLAPYFRSLYHIVKLVKKSDLAEDEKRRYTSLLRAQLTKHELYFLFYDGLSSFGKGFKPLIEEFGLLEHFDTSVLLYTRLKEDYAGGAFN
jgi:hypothetical protein